MQFIKKLFRNMKNDFSRLINYKVINAFDLIQFIRTLNWEEKNAIFF